MSEQKIEDFICDVLTSDAQKRALEFVQYLRANEMEFERGRAYWEDKFYWGIKYNDEYVCFILLNNEEKTDAESWTIWSDDSGATTIGDSSVDEQTKKSFWKFVNICEKENKCFEGCKRSSRTILGKRFDNVCGTAIKFENPDTETIQCMKKMVEIRKNDILKSANCT